jgi:Tfp pilus assembly protein PilZ
MAQWVQEERRQSTRYEVTLSTKAVHGLMGNALTITAHDISAKGAGFIVDQKLTPGEMIELYFIMPDNAEQISASGKVVWVGPLGPERYRVGVVFSDHDLRPIPMVLRSIKMRTSRYSC